MLTVDVPVAPNVAVPEDPGTVAGFQLLAVP